MQNVIRGKFDLSKKGKYDRKEVCKKLYEYYYEQIKREGLYSHVKYRKNFPKTAKTFGKVIEGIINETAETHCSLDISGYSQMVYGVWGVITKEKKRN